jgi:hypothetical protein
LATRAVEFDHVRRCQQIQAFRERHLVVLCSLAILAFLFVERDGNVDKRLCNRRQAYPGARLALQLLLHLKLEQRRRVRLVGSFLHLHRLQEMLEEFTGVLLAHGGKLGMVLADQLLEHGGRDTVLSVDLAILRFHRHRISSTSQTVCHLAHLAVEALPVTIAAGQGVLACHLKVSVRQTVSI